MKAVILAAGKGERLKEITYNLPKPMLKYKGQPLLEHNIILCRKFGIKEIYINTHHLPNKITDYFGNGEKFNVSISYSYEKELLGTSGALNSFKSELGNDSFFILYGDNVSDFNLDLLRKKAVQSDALSTIAFHYREDVSSSGVAEFDVNYRIKKFIEKPQPGETDSHWVNAGIYYFNPGIFDYIPNGFSDFGKDIFPKLIRNNIKIYGVCTNSNVDAFDTPELLNEKIEDSYASQK